jgi:hypothetical protein
MGWVMGWVMMTGWQQCTWRVARQNRGYARTLAKTPEDPILDIYRAFDDQDGDRSSLGGCVSFEGLGSLIWEIAEDGGRSASVWGEQHAVGSADRQRTDH